MHIFPLLDGQIFRDNSSTRAVRSVMLKNQAKNLNSGKIFRPKSKFGQNFRVKVYFWSFQRFGHLVNIRAKNVVPPKK